jgi:phage terminase large subunit-like protein
MDTAAVNGEQGTGSQLPEFGSWEWRVATYRRTVEQNPWIPEDVRGRGLRENPKQRQFLLLTDVEEVFYGGAAGCGKSFATLIAATQYVDVPGYAALLLRENFGDLNKAGAWMELSRQWWYKKGPEFNERDRCWRFPSGATITFGYLDSDKAVYQYDGPSFHFIAIDELTQHSEWRYQFMFKPLRRPTTGPLSKLPLRMRATSNPGNVGHEWVKKRFGCGNADPRQRAPGAVFVPATLTDNAGNLDVDDYRAKLAKLDPLTRKQREDGNWDAVEGGRFKKEWFGSYRTDRSLRDTVILTAGPAHGGEEVERFQPDKCSCVQTCDPAASTSKDADYFVLSTWIVTPKANIIWWGCHRAKYEIQEQVSNCQDLYRRYRPQFIAVEEVLNQRALAQLLRRSTRPVMIVKGVSPRGQNKADHAAGFISLAASGRVFLPERGQWRQDVFPLEDVIDELVRFTGDSKKDGKDDIVDSASYFAEMLPLVRAGYYSGGGRPPIRHESKSLPFSGLR